MKIRIFIVVGLLLLMISGSVLAQTGGAYDLSWNTAAGNGGITFSSGGSYQLGGTIGQAEVNKLSGGTYSLDGGFWAQQQMFAVFLPGVSK